MKNPQNISFSRLRFWMFLERILNIIQYISPPEIREYEAEIIMEASILPWNISLSIRNATSTPAYTHSVTLDRVSGPYLPYIKRNTFVFTLSKKSFINI